MATGEGANPENPAAEALAEAAGLRLAWVGHRGDVEAAVAGVSKLRASFSRPTDPAAEPVPPYAMPPDASRRDAGR